MDNRKTNDEEEEEILVYMDFNTKLDDECISAEKEFKIIGLDTEKPVLQLGNQVYQGDWKDAMGTHVIFEEDENPQRCDTFFENPETMMKLSCKTDKILHMSRIFLNVKKKTNDVDLASESSA